jgi:hypothetical protein
MEDEKIKEILEEQGIKSEIRCPEAFMISDKFGIPKSEISAYCNKYGIKIRGCQLGCFK